MLRAVVWKEFREQAPIGLTLVALGSGVLVAAATLLDPPSGSAAPTDVFRYLGPGLLAALMLAVTAGTVCGGALFAAEREAGTAGFLEALPVARGRLWRAKVAGGAALAGAQVFLVVLVATALGLVPHLEWVGMILRSSLLAFCWGVLGSTVARTTLGSVGVAIPAATVAAFVYLFPIMLFLPGRGNVPRESGQLLFFGLMLATPLGLSAFLYGREDRARLAAALPPLGPLGNGPPEPAGAAGLGLVALAWLAARQLRGPAGVLSGLAVLFGLGLLAPGVSPVLYWPALALTAGVAAGVVTVADEQAHGTARFWGERRLPVGRAWAVKVAAGLLLAAWLGFLLAAPSLVRGQAGGGGVRGSTALATAFRALLLDHIPGQQGKYLLLPLLYGFAAGHLAAVLFRKVVVALGVGALVGGSAAVLWAPSLLAGGLEYWQLLLPPGAAVATAGLLARAWGADRLATRPSLNRLAGGLAGVAVLLAAGLGWRAVEVPAVAGADDDVALVAGLPVFDANQTGRDFRAAAELFARAYTRAGGVAYARPRAPEADPFGVARLRSPVADGRLDLVIRLGWPRPHPATALVGGAGAAFPPALVPPDPTPLVDAAYDPDHRSGAGDLTWYEQAARAAAADRDDRAAGRPPGMFEDPRLIPVNAPLSTLENARLMGKVIAARGLQRQAGGDPGGFVGELATALALARSLNHNGVVAAAQAGQSVERDAVVAADRWLDRAADRPDQFRAVAAELAAADRTDTFDPATTLLAQRHVLRETMKAPAQWLTDQITPPNGNKDAVAPEVDLVGVAWTVPWEKERLARLVGTRFERGGAEWWYVRGRPGAGYFVPPAGKPDLEAAGKRTRALRRAVMLKAALRAYLAETGAAAPDLNALVAAGLLPAVPDDPYADGPFRYRVSAGEWMDVGWTGRERTPVRVWVPAGRGVVWGVGADGKDDGGTKAPAVGPDPGPMEADVVFLVPPGSG